MRHESLLYFVLMIFIFSCRNDLSRGEFKNHGSIKIKVVDTFYSTPIKMLSKNIENAYYPLVYIGEWKSRIKVTDSVDFEKYYYSNYGYEKGSLPFAPKVNIFVDTEQNIFRRLVKRKIHNGSINYFSAKGVQFKNDTVLDYISSYPVIITSGISDTITIGSDEHIPCILEAENMKGLWCPIEEPKHYFCGNSMGGMFLAPNDVAVTSVIIYQGSYKTQCRLRLNNSFSNVFNCNVSIGQFSKNEYE